MPVDWKFSKQIELCGQDKLRIDRQDGERQRFTADAILSDLQKQPGVVLADEVGMGKTYVALAVAASVIDATRGRGGPVVIMVPSRLRRKWEREWRQFKRHCTVPGSFDWVRAEYARTPTEFLKLRDDRGPRRCHLIFVTTGCFTQGLQDPWIKLAFIRLARRQTKLSPQMKSRIARWAAMLVRQVTSRKLTAEVVAELIRRPVGTWKEILVRHGIMTEADDDPIPEQLARYEHHRSRTLNWKPLCEFIRTKLPARSSSNIGRRMTVIRQEFNQICLQLYGAWLKDAKWVAPLLILDEAHHAKNDTTQLAKLFREQREGELTLLAGKFRRMLLLTATPFQLGHHELIQILRTFGAVLWTGDRAPAGTKEQFHEQVQQLAEALDKNRLAGRNLDQLWGKLRRDLVGEQTPEAWWSRVETAAADEWERQLVESVQECLRTKRLAEQQLRPWVIRHNRLKHFSLLVGDDSKPQLRRESYAGRAILDPEGTIHDVGLPISENAVLPFLLCARAQGELSSRVGARAFFAEGLSSSYEAFHHTRDARGDARDMDDEGRVLESSVTPSEVPMHVPVAWYETQVAKLIPSKRASRSELLAHPKVAATVQRVLKLWEGGEKVLVFCVYRETARALYEHLKEEVEQRLIHIAGTKLGLDPLHQYAEIENRISRIARRISEEGRPFYEEVQQILVEPFEDAKYAVLGDFQQKLTEVLTAYFRSPSFIARYLPLDDPDLRDAWERGEGRPEVLERGRIALRRCIQESPDESEQTLLARVYQFLDFAAELAERSHAEVDDANDDQEDEAEDPLRELLQTVAVYSKSRRRSLIDADDFHDPDDDDGNYRVVPLVRMVFGKTPPQTRDRLAQAFNSPLFPEILVSSSVMGEGIDLHRFCRHVIHHDGFWNPSTLEQQTGRLDRIRSKSELCRRPIRIFQPYIAGGADEKMYRVLRDRERWFQVVMGQKFEFDEAVSEELANRVPLPTELAERLTFDLARWKLTLAEIPN